MIADPESPPYLSEAYARAVPTWRASYSDRTAAMMAAFSQLAYLPFIDAQPPSRPGAPKLEKPDGQRALAAHLAPAGFELKVVFNRDDVQAFLAVNPKQFAVLAFRGTANFADWKIDLDVGRTPLPGFPSVGVHRGFWGAFQALSAEITAAVNQHVPNDLGLYITGHSLGSAPKPAQRASPDRASALPRPPREQLFAARPALRVQRVQPGEQIGRLARWGGPRVGGAGDELVDVDLVDHGMVRIGW